MAACWRWVERCGPSRRGAPCSFFCCGRRLALASRFLLLRALRPLRALQSTLLWPPAGAGVVLVGCGPFGRGVPLCMCAVVAACWRWCCAFVLLRPLLPQCALQPLVLLWPLLALGGALRALLPRCAGRFSGCGRLLALVLRLLQLRGLRPRRALQCALLWPRAGAGSRLSAACPSAAVCPAACLLLWPPAVEPPLLFSMSFQEICEQVTALGGRAL